MLGIKTNAFYDMIVDLGDYFGFGRYSEVISQFTDANDWLLILNHIFLGLFYRILYVLLIKMTSHTQKTHNCKILVFLVSLKI